MKKITFLFGSEGKAGMIITDAGGRQVYTSSGNLQKGSNTIVLSLSGLAAGSYTLHVRVDNGTVVPLRFVKL